MKATMRGSCMSGVQNLWTCSMLKTISAILQIAFIHSGHINLGMTTRCVEFLLLTKANLNCLITTSNPFLYHWVFQAI